MLGLIGSNCSQTGIFTLVNLLACLFLHHALTLSIRKQPPVFPIIHLISIKNHPHTSIAALLVGVQVDPPRLAGGPPDQIQPLIQLAQLVVTPTPVRDDIYSVQSELDVGGVGSEEFLAGLAAERGIVELEDGLPQGCSALPGECSDLGGQGAVLDH